MKLLHIEGLCKNVELNGIYVYITGGVELGVKFQGLNSSKTPT